MSQFLEIEGRAGGWGESLQSGKRKSSTWQMEGANHCYEIEMTSNYLLAANVRVASCCATYPPTPTSSFHLHSTPLVCCGGDVRSEMRPSPHLKKDQFFFFEKNVETEKIGVVKQSWCH